MALKCQTAASSRMTLTDWNGKGKCSARLQCARKTPKVLDHCQHLRINPQKYCNWSSKFHNGKTKTCWALLTSSQTFKAFKVSESELRLVKNCEVLQVSNTWPVGLHIFWPGHIIFKGIQLLLQSAQMLFSSLLECFHKNKQQYSNSICFVSEKIFQRPPMPWHGESVFDTCRIMVILVASVHGHPLIPNQQSQEFTTISGVGKPHVPRFWLHLWFGKLQIPATSHHSHMASYQCLIIIVSEVPHGWHGLSSQVIIRSVCSPKLWEFQSEIQQKQRGPNNDVLHRAPRIFLTNMQVETHGSSWKLIELTSISKPKWNTRHL